MLTEYEIQLCLIRGSQDPSNFLLEAEQELKDLFPEEKIRELRHKSDDQVEIILAEIGGMNRYQSEQEVLEHLENRGSDLFWSWLQGYRVAIEEKDASCGCCKAKTH